MKHPLLTAERTAQEIDFIEERLSLVPGAPVLDIGCGFGRHSIELARRGYDVTGIDPSAAMIAEARRRAAEAGVVVDFWQEWGERFSSVHLYDAAICLFTTFGQITVQSDTGGLIKRIYKVLQEGACFVVEVPQRDTAVSQLKRQETIGEGNRMAFVSRSYDADTHILSEEFRVVLENEENTYLLKYKLFDRAALENHLALAGFIEISAFGDYQGNSLTAEDGAMVMVARKGS